MNQGEKPLVSAIVLTRGKTALLENCLESLGPALAGIPSEVCILEHETDLAKQVQTEKYPEYRYLQIKDAENARESFATLNNAAVLQTTGDYIFLVNNDVVLQPGTLVEMLKTMDERKDVGIVGAKLLFPQGTVQHIGVVLDAFGVPKHLGWGRPDNGEYEPANRSEYFDAVTFACVLIRRKVWEEVGGLDPDYHFNFEDIDFCLKARRLKWRSYANLKAVAYHFESQASQFRQTFEHSVPRNLKVFRDKWIFSGEMEKVLGVPIHRQGGPLHDERPNIAFVPAGEGAGISWWRIDQVANMLVENGLANVQRIYANSDESKVMQILSLADLVVWQGSHHPSVKRIAGMRDDRSFGMVYEYDDHPIHISPFAEAYRVFGCQEFQIKPIDGGDPVWLWRDGEAGFDLERNRQNRQRQLEIMALCDSVTTTNDKLAAYFRTLNPSVFVLPNCINFKVYKPPSDVFERKDGPIRIGWWGGDNHWHDISAVGKPLVDFVNSHDVKLLLLGAFYKGPLRGIDPSKVEDHPWVHVEAFPWRLAMAGLDVVIVPLANPLLPGMAFNHYKSEIKWLEAAALKIPAVVQGGVAPYQNCRNGETALTFLSDEDFKDALEALCLDAQLRKRIGQGAYDWAREHRDLEKEAYRWAEAYDKVIRSRRGTLPKEEAVAQEA